MSPFTNILHRRKMKFSHPTFIRRFSLKWVHVFAADVTNDCIVL